MAGTALCFIKRHFSQFYSIDIETPRFWLANTLTQGWCMKKENVCMYKYKYCAIDYHSRNNITKIINCRWLWMKHGKIFARNTKWDQWSKIAIFQGTTTCTIWSILSVLFVGMTCIDNVIWIIMLQRRCHSLVSSSVTNWLVNMITRRKTSKVTSTF